MSKLFRKQPHTIYGCKYHLIFCTKYPYRVLTNEVRQNAKESIEKLVRQKDESEILELNLQADHVPLLLGIPPKYSVASLMGYLKEKLANRILQRCEKLGKSIRAGICGVGVVGSAR